MIVLPIGERWALVAVLTAATTPRVTFWVLLAGCAFAAVYTTAGRVLRSLRGGRVEEGRPGPRRPRRRRTAHRAAPPLLGPRRRGRRRARRRAGDGLRPPVGRRMADRPRRRRLRGLLRRRPRPPSPAASTGSSPLFRAAEYGTVLVLAADAEVNGALPAAYGLVSAVAYHHYDTVYRIRGDAGAPRVRRCGRPGARRSHAGGRRPGGRAHRARFHRRAHGPRRGRGSRGARREHPLLGDRPSGWRARRTRRRRTRMIGLVLAAGATAVCAPTPTRCPRRWCRWGPRA